MMGGVCCTARVRKWHTQEPPVMGANYSRYRRCCGPKKSRGSAGGPPPLTHFARLAGTTVVVLAPVRVRRSAGRGFGAPAGLIYCTEQSLATGEKRGNRG